jgi:hypothetical protein
MASILNFPPDRMERTKARTFVLPDDRTAAIDFDHVLRRLEEIIRLKQRAQDPAKVIDLKLYRGAYVLSAPQG